MATATDMTPSDIVPQKTLNNIDSMYYYLKQKLNDAKQITDLIPFIKKLTSIKELKQHLNLSLDKQYKSAEPESDTNIRSLFVSLFSLNGIPSDNIHAHILSFLPAIEYKKLPLLSKHFRFILRNNPYLYNNKGYTTRLEFQIDPKDMNDKSKTRVLIHHAEATWEADLGINFSAAANPRLTPKDIENCTIPMHQLKRWCIKEQYHWDRQRVSKSVNYFDDAHNKYILELLADNTKTIEKLEMKLQTKKLIQKVLNTDNIKFNQCKVLSITDSNDIILKDVNVFKKLQCLEIFVTKYNYDRITTLKSINSMIKCTASTLKCFQLKKERSSVPFYNNAFHATQDDDAVYMAKGVEFCSIEVESKIKIDLSECVKLIGVQLLGVDFKDIKWPKRSDYVIPFVCIGDGKDLFDQIIAQQLNMRSICLLKREEIPSSEASDEIGGYYREPNYEWKYEDDKVIQQRVSAVKALSECKEEAKCMVLDKESCDKMLFYRILEYAVNDENKRNKMLKQCKRWWYLNSANWIVNISYVLNMVK